MDKVDAYFRAKKKLLIELNLYGFYRDEIEKLKKVNIEDEVFVTTKFVCTINEDWVRAIEKSITFIEKAIAEDRQFIRVDGETIPIEKVKKVSKDSVRHLAKHSEMVTHISENPNDDIIPDELYITEKITDYAVYENRFLYMLLDYMEKFISLRLNEIDKLHSKYICKVKIKKAVEEKNHNFSFEINMLDEVFNNPYSIVSDECKSIVNRIRDSLQMVNAFLRTPLMTEVAKAPMIRLPITKTNVLKMNNNFKNAVSLFEYLSTYEGLGYTVEEVNKEFHPFKDEISDEFYTFIRLLQFSSYEYGNEITSILLNNYKAEELRRKEEEAKNLQKRIDRMRKNAKDSEKTLEEYMLLLEERNLQLLKDSEELVRANNEILKLNETIEKLNKQINSLKDKIVELNNIIEQKDAEIARLNQKYLDDMAALKKEHEAQIISLQEAHNEDIEALNDEHEQKLAEAQNQFQVELNAKIDEYQNEIDTINSEIEQRVLAAKYAFIEEHGDYKTKYLELSSQNTELQQTHQEAVKTYEQKIDELVSNYKETIEKNTITSETKIKELTEENEALSYKYHLYKGELDAQRFNEGKLVPTEELTSRERFVELEEEYKAFEDFFMKQWKLTKKQIRKEIIGKK